MNKTTNKKRGIATIAMSFFMIIAFVIGAVGSVLVVAGPGIIKDLLPEKSAESQPTSEIPADNTPQENSNTPASPVIPESVPAVEELEEGDAMEMEASSASSSVLTPSELPTPDPRASPSLASSVHGGVIGCYTPDGKDILAILISGGGISEEEEVASNECVDDVLKEFEERFALCTPSSGNMIAGWEFALGIIRGYEIVGEKDSLCEVDFVVLDSSALTERSLLGTKLSCLYPSSERTLEDVEDPEKNCSGSFINAVNSL